MSISALRNHRGSGAQHLVAKAVSIARPTVATIPDSAAMTLSHMLTSRGSVRRSKMNSPTVWTMRALLSNHGASSLPIGVPASCASVLQQTTHGGEGRRKGSEPGDLQHERCTERWTGRFAAHGTLRGHLLLGRGPLGISGLREVEQIMRPTT